MIFEVSSISGLLEDSRLYLSASAFSLLQYVALVETYEDNLASHRYVVGKGDEEFSSLFK